MSPQVHLTNWLGIQSFGKEQTDFLIEQALKNEELSERLSKLPRDRDGRWKRDESCPGHPRDEQERDGSRYRYNEDRKNDITSKVVVEASAFYDVYDS